MEVGFSLARLPLGNVRMTHEHLLLKHPNFSTAPTPPRKKQLQWSCKTMVVQAKGKRARKNPQSQRQRQRPPMPRIKEDANPNPNPKFVVFIRMANDYSWYPISIITGGTTAKIMVAAKDTFIGKYLYKDTIARNITAVIYRDEKEMQKTAFKQHRVLRSCSEFRYGYKLVKSTDPEVALSSLDVIELPTQDELKTVFDKVKDFIGGTKDSFGKLTALNSTTEPSEEESKEIS